MSDDRMTSRVENAVIGTSLKKPANQDTFRIAGTNTGQDVSAWLLQYQALLNNRR